MWKNEIRPLSTKLHKKYHQVDQRPHFDTQNATLVGESISSALQDTGVEKAS